MVVALSAGLIGAGLVPAVAAESALVPVSQEAGAAQVSAAAAAKTVTVVKTTANLNLRKKPGKQYESLATLKKGTVVAKTGKTSGKWWQVKVGKNTGWVSSEYLKTSTVVAKTGTPKPQVKTPAGSSRWIDGTQAIYAKAAKTSKRLMAQTGGTKVKLLKTVGKWSQVQTPTGKGWIEKSELVTSASKASGNSRTHRWTVAASNVRRGPSTAHASYGILPANQKVAFIRSANGWSKVTTPKGTTGWIRNTQLTVIEYRALKKLQPKTIAMISAVKKRYGKSLIGVGGVRSGSSGHGDGLAADFMIKGYGSAAGIKAGDKMAAYLVANHENLGLEFIIWRDRIWLAYDGQWGAYSKGGWGKHLEVSRGWNTTTRHMDHIHAEIERPVPRK